MLNKQTYSLRLLINKISVRERIIVLVLFILLAVLIAQGIVMLLGYDKKDIIEASIQQKQEESIKYQETLKGLESAIDNPRVRALQRSNQDIEYRIERIKEQIENINEKLMSPARMSALVKELLEKQDDLTLLSFHVLPVVVIQSSSIEAENLFYQHGLAIELEGSYEALTEYLTQIEALPTQLFWDKLYIETDKFPQLRIQLEVHTLSQDEEWLHV